MKKFCVNVAIYVLAPLIVLFLYDYLKGDKVFTTIKSVWYWIVIFLNFELKVWWVLLGISVIIAILYVIVNRDGNERPEFIGYKEDHFRVWKWSWDWRWDSVFKYWRIYNLKPLCPKCDTPMNINYREESFKCPRCGAQYENRSKEYSYDVEAVIWDNIKRKNFTVK